MNNAAQKIVDSSKANVEALQDLASQSLAGLEKLVELNMSTSKAVLTDGINHAQALMGAKDVQQAMTLQAAAIKPMAERAVSYGRDFYSIASATSNEIAEVVDAKLAEAQASINALIDNLAEKAPAGAEPAVAALKAALAASQNALDSARSSVKKAVEVAESSLSSLAERAVNAATSAASKR